MKTQLGVLVLLAFCGCQTTTEAPSCPAVSALSSAPYPITPNPQTVLDGLDSRVPVPLLPLMANHQKQNMRDHVAAVQEIILATSKNDFATVEKAAARIGYSETMGQMCTHMGAGAPGFTERALAFHHNADRIGEAAKKREPAAVLSALGQTLDECRSCHAVYKQRVVDDATWAAASGEQAPAIRHRMN